MITAIYVTQPTRVLISTSEPGLELASLTAPAVPLDEGDSTHEVTRGVYKIAAGAAVSVVPSVPGAAVTYGTGGKDNPPPSLGTVGLTELDANAVSTFLIGASSDAKHLERP